MIRRACIGVPLLVMLAVHFALAQSPGSEKTPVVMLGTGTPLPDPARSGPATAIIANETAYLVDAGTGIVRRAAAARDKGVKALEPTNLRIAFLTHLHADHTLGLSDLNDYPVGYGKKRAARTLWP